MESLIRCWKGYVQIQIRGNSPERFMNLCRNRGIILWKIRRQGEYDTCCLALRDVWKLKALVKKSGVSIRIIKKRGIPFFINRNKNRKAAYFSACFSFLGIYLLSLFLWDIQFEGNIHYTDDVLMQFLYEMDMFMECGFRKLPVKNWKRKSETSIMTLIGYRL